MGLIILIFILIVSGFVVVQNAKEMESDTDDPKEKYKLSRKFIITIIGAFAFALIVFAVAIIFL